MCRGYACTGLPKLQGWPGGQPSPRILFEYLIYDVDAVFDDRRLQHIYVCGNPTCSGSQRPFSRGDRKTKTSVERSAVGAGAYRRRATPLKIRTATLCAKENLLEYKVALSQYSSIRIRPSCAPLAAICKSSVSYPCRSLWCWNSAARWGAISG